MDSVQRRFATITSSFVPPSSDSLHFVWRWIAEVRSTDFVKQRPGEVSNMLTDTVEQRLANTAYTPTEFVERRPAKNPYALTDIVEQRLF